MASELEELEMLAVELDFPIKTSAEIEKRHLSRQCGSPVFRDPNRVKMDIEYSVRAPPIFHHPRSLSGIGGTGVTEGRKMREVIKGKRWLLLSRWKNLEPKQRSVLNQLFQLNRRVFKAYLLKESLEQLWNYRYEGEMANYLKKWMDQLRWQRLPSFQKLAAMLIDHIDGILNYRRTKVRFGVVEAINGNIRIAAIFNGLRILSYR